MSLSDKEMLLLDCFMYSDLATNPSNSQRTLEEIISQFIDDSGQVSEALIRDAIDNKDVFLSGDLPGHADYLCDILSQIYEDDRLRNLRITATTPEYKGSIRAACFYDESTGEATVAFRGTGGSYEQWGYNFEGYGDESQQAQRDAEAFINSLPYDFVDVTGHSNGGNQAMYVAIACGDKVSYCLAYEGQGFSNEFLLAHPEYKEHCEKITNICGEKDAVGLIMNDTAGKTAYVKSDIESAGGLFSHGAYGLLHYANANNSFDEEGNFKEDAFVPQAWYCAILHYVTAFLADCSDVPVVGDALELVSDFIGIVVGIYISENGNCLRIWDPKVMEKWYMAYQDLKESLHDYIASTVELSRSIEFIYNSVKKWYEKNFSYGYKNASENPFIQIDTYHMKNYVQRIQSINNRIDNLDGMMNRLYWKVGLSDSLTVLKVDAITCYSWRLSRCITFLLDTANNFEKTEVELIKSL